ncbi:MAG: SDR family NAD(P)-dependent oxidoreductase [Burkholderiales bacterium]|jgi:NAD(P)-dependent dehydrogenase (short-subunit alcohol dehydrogenase family)|nr:SDR family NAD(P)-dependent oxidoreductase [Burkholderiales bacterium]
MKRDKTLAWTPPATIDFTGKKIAIVGGTGGIGRALAHQFAAKGAQIIVVGRTFRDEGIAGINPLLADLSKMKEAERVGQTLPAEELDILLFTTGIFADYVRQETADGLEQDVAIGYLNRLVILRNMGARLNQPRPDHKRPRVFIMGYPGTGRQAVIDDLNSEKSYARWTAHQNSVAGNEALVYDISKRYPNLDVFGLNPGFVQTDIRDEIFFKRGGLLNKIGYWITAFMTRTPEDYAQRVLPLFIVPELTGQSGKHFDKNGNAILPSNWVNDANCKELIRASEKLISRAGVCQESEVRD